MADENQNNPNTKSDEEYSLDWLFDEQEEEEDVKAKKQEAEDIFWKHWGNDSPVSSVASSTTEKSTSSEDEFDWFLGQQQPAPQPNQTPASSQPSVANVSNSQPNSQSTNTTPTSNKPTAQGIKVATAKIPASSVNGSKSTVNMQQQSEKVGNSANSIQNNQIDQLAQHRDTIVLENNNNSPKTTGASNKIIATCITIALLSLGIAVYIGYQLFISNKTCYHSKVVLAQTHIGQSLLVNIEDKKRGQDLLNKGYINGRISYLLYTILKPGETFVDVGAGYGYYSLYASRIVGPNGMVYSIEGDKYAASMLSASMRLNNIGNVAVYNNTLYNRIVNEPIPNGYNSELQITSLDAILPDLHSVSLMHVNTGGNEAQVILGAKSIIMQSPNIRIITNMTKESFVNSNAATAFSQIANLGFKFWIINENDNNLKPVNNLSEIQELDECSVLIARGM